MQVPCELASLTTLTMLNLSMSAGSVFTDGRGTVPKMRVTEQSCRFLLHFPALAALRLDVTGEERAALAGFLADLQAGRDCPCDVILRHSLDFIAEGLVNQGFRIV